MKNLFDYNQEMADTTDIPFLIDENIFAYYSSGVISPEMFIMNSGGTEMDDITRIWFDEIEMHIKLRSGKYIHVELAKFPSLLNATEEARNTWEIIGNERGIHWESLDEDISIPALLR